MHLLPWLDALLGFFPQALKGLVELGDLIFKEGSSFIMSLCSTFFVTSVALEEKEDRRAFSLLLILGKIVWQWFHSRRKETPTIVPGIISHARDLLHSLGTAISAHKIVPQPGFCQHCQKWFSLISPNL